MITHELKIQREYADAVVSGDKTFEVRLNDRGYQRGDHIKFNAINKAMFAINHPINDKEYEITYVLSGWGIKDNWVAFAMKECDT